MSFLDRKVNIKSSLVKMTVFTRDLLSRLRPKPKAPKAPKPRHDESFISQANQLHYGGFESTAPVSGHLDYGAILSGICQPPKPNPETLPWFLSGVPEQYRKHYTEWIVNQPSGAPWSYQDYRSGTFYPDGGPNGPRGYLRYEDLS